MESITIHGAREHNLKNIKVTLPRNKLVVITGLSGSGKSSLAFDTLYAEGYRKYIDSLSSKARLLLEQVKKPDLDYIEGLSPVIAIEQHVCINNNPRSTLATTTEIADYARLVWAARGIPHCPKDKGKVRERSLVDCIQSIFNWAEGTKLMILAPFYKAESSTWGDELNRLRQKGFSRVRVNNQIYLIDDIDLKIFKGKSVVLDIVLDRVVIQENQRSRIIDSLELAFHEGKDKAIACIFDNSKQEWIDVILNKNLSCDVCGEHYPRINPRYFSYNYPEGTCMTCSGIGKTLQFQPSLVVPDTKKTIHEGAIKGMRIGSRIIMIRQKSLLRQLSQHIPFDMHVPWEDLDKKTQESILYGTKDPLLLKFGRAKPKLVPFEGVLKILEDLFKKTTSQAIRTRLMSFQTSSPCPECKGSRLSAYVQNILVDGVSFGEFMDMSLIQAYSFVKKLLDNSVDKGVNEALEGLCKRLNFLNEVGLGYLSLNRDYNTLSGGEAQRTRLATQLGMGLMGVLYILDEPSIGLHPQDNQSLLKALVGLQEKGNSVVVVEHDEMIIRQADHLLELGPGAGACGGNVVFEGSIKQCLKDKHSRTGAFLSGREIIQSNTTRKTPQSGFVRVLQAKENNLKNIDVGFPIGLFTCVCGVSGSGKSTLVNDILARAAALVLNKAKAIPGRHKKIDGLKYFERLICVDQEPIGRSPRSNPVTFIKAFDALREVFAECPLSKIRGYTPSRFSFNVRGGRCERCQGDGMIKVDMQFLDDVYTECTSCQGKRYNSETLDVSFKGHTIADVLQMTVDQACDLFKAHPKLMRKLDLLKTVGLGYLKLGQPATTLSGGEAQRIKLSLELSKSNSGKAIYILDEPTTGLHFEDIQKLVDLLFKLRDAGHTIIVIEHQLDIVRIADWIIELGPNGGQNGGFVVFEGTPDLLKKEKTPTALALKPMT